MKTTLISIGIITSQLVCWAGSSAPSGDYTAHEWGTFTSVQGADGKLLMWDPLASSKLPQFVYDRRKPSGHMRLAYSTGKDSYVSLQRMETPVIYFYSDRPQNVDVTVRFPKGLITEWYPFAETVGPSWKTTPLPIASWTDSTQQAAPKNSEFRIVPENRDSLIRWPQVAIGSAQAADQGPLLPNDTAASHYFAARATDANLLEVRSTGNSPQQRQREKFLFYRGIGSFETPLEVTQDSPGHVTLHNRGKGDLARLFVLNVQNGRGALLTSGALPAGQSRTLALSESGGDKPLAEVISRLSEEMEDALKQGGLYPREATAMVNTWRDSWFEEPGLRVLYLLPRTWTDDTLPLDLVPAPHALVRVMVGRAEVITPNVANAVRQQIVQFSGSDAEAKAQAVAGFQSLHLGRFAEPAIRLALGNAPSQRLGAAGWELLAASRKTGNIVAQN
jgi:hypothetical protein